MDTCPLSGKPCAKHKTINVTDITKEKLIDLHLCDECGIEYSQKLSLIKLPTIPNPNLDSLINWIDKVANLETDIYSKKCTCGTTYKKIVENSRFGCGNCYSTFESLALDLFYRCQDGLKHVGKKPNTWDCTILNEATVEKIRKLREKIKKAVAVENYEVAAELKRMIEELENPKGNYEI